MPNSPALPTKETLEGDLRHLRRLLDQRDEPFYKVKALQSVARRLCSGDRDVDSITGALRLAIGLLGANRSAEWAAALYGLTDESRGKPLAERRELAYQISDAESFETFRTKFEPELISALAELLADLNAQHEPGAESTTKDRLEEKRADPIRESASSDRSASKPELWIQLKVDLCEAGTVLDPASGCLVLVGPDHTFRQLALAIYSEFALEYVGSSPTIDLTGTNSPIGLIVDLAKQPDGKYLRDSNGTSRLFTLFRAQL